MIAARPLGITGSDLGFLGGAGEGNRTLMTSLEGWGSAIELRPRGGSTARCSVPVPARPRRQGGNGFIIVAQSADGLSRTQDLLDKISFGFGGMWRSLVSAPALGAGGRGFESRHPDQVRVGFRS